jgi:NitT/TauT family transport system substrate-binding protein
MITLLENFRAVFYAPFYAAEALGSFKAEGLDVALRTSPAPERSLTSLRDGTGDVSWGGPLRVMNTLDKDRTAGYACFCEVVGRDPFFLLGRTPNPAFQLKDLVGKSLGVVTEVPTPWICLRYDLRLAGIDPESIVCSPGRTMGDNCAALRSAQVDVVQVFQPYAQELLASGAGHLWYASASRGPTAYTTFNTTRTFLEKNPELALGMTRAMYRTLKWIAAHEGRDLARALAGYFQDISEETLAACFDRYKSLGLWNRDPRVQRAGIEWLRDAMLAAGSISTRLAYEECVDNRFAEQVVRENPPSI